jgi:hypothetical protein
MFSRVGRPRGTWRSITVWKGEGMSGIGKFKLSDALKSTSNKLDAKKAKKPKPGQSTVAEQTRENTESKRAKNAESSNRDRMIDIGRGGRQAGRQGGG